MATFAWILVACAGCGVALYSIGMWATTRHKRLRPPTLADDRLPPVSMLKPIKGLEEQLAENLRTFFEQDYPAPLEIVFASTERDDPGMDVARCLASEYPHVRVRFVRSDAAFGLNPKVANLAGAMGAASHDLVLQSDANVRARPDYLRRVVSELLAADASLLTSMVVGVGERSAGAALENLQLSAFIGPAMCTALHVAGINCVVGKSMLLRRSELATLGGLELVRDILAEDFILGREYQRAGLKVVLSATPVENVNERIGIDQFFARHSRWLKMRAVIHVGGFVADLLVNPVALLTAAVLVSGFDPLITALLVGVALLKTMGDAFLMRLVRGKALRPRHMFLSPVKDVIMGVAWLYSVASRSVVWRGVRLRLLKDSRLAPAPDRRRPSVPAPPYGGSPILEVLSSTPAPPRRALSPSGGASLEAR